ncbi:MAG TPA: redoxin domain-containing protein [Oxalicibacterium sp.]
MIFIKTTRAAIGKWLIPLLCVGMLHVAHATDTAKTTNAKENVNEGESRAHSAGKSLIGAPAPDVKLTTIDGKHIDLAALRGKQPVYLKFWATWCVPCREQMPGFERIYKEDGKRIKVIAVNVGFSDNADAVREYKKKIPMSMPIVVDDGSLAGAFNVRVTPTHVLIDKDGRIAYIGHLEDDKFHAALARVMSGETVPVAARRSGAKPFQHAILKRGDVVTDLTVAPIGGASMPLATPGKPRALVFTAPWCESYLSQSRPEVAQACRRVRLESEQLAKKGNVEWLTIASGLWASEQDLLDYKKTNGFAMPLALDANGILFRTFNITKIPTVVLLDANNRIVQLLGPNDVELDKAVQTLQRK